MRLPKWGLLIFNMLLCAAFAYVSISSYSNGAMIWWLWGLISILYGFTTITLFVKGVKEGWSSTEIVEDERTWNVRLVSCFISFIFIQLFLTVGIIAYYTENLSLDPVAYMILAVTASVVVFAIAQVVQSIQK
ncbi:hypothetical protein [Sporosarcina sp. FSL K6-3508]|uniref:hypothetical protein n=1 Tax=Sporosarcina sp. FSL K6-3508 TaxID=2921557 RepID=UPI003159B47B